MGVGLNVRLPAVSSICQCLFSAKVISMEVMFDLLSDSVLEF